MRHGRDGGPRRDRAGLPLAGLALTAALALTGCTSSGYPADPDGTYDRATGGTLRVGAVHHPPYVDASGAEPEGSEAELVEGFARSIDADIEWTVTGEAAAMTALKEGDLDLVAGGLTTKTPWTTHAAITRSYAEDTGPDGKTARLVMAVPLGENQMLTELERYLDTEHPGARP
ncbi:transporter substrate-binding domain-containing protein [Citricoccus sp. SGAir0253]|uniref:transporter substrate-binding domain-containing protein n=1 Tax=Citricoccus sp. SGAir0253 TaxID=2567881 RepID=UPI0010CD0CD7|nr:transporter substrate-binding domain-containing protein [Citricoccus sp. SGAir0253]QCU77537.1 transporter substrate-binding domain-containing protein [Citricoccus sp. SGAir0253]